MSKNSIINTLLLLFSAIYLLLSGCRAENNNDTVKITNNIMPTEIAELNPDDTIDKNSLRAAVTDIKGVFNPLFARTDGDRATSDLIFLPLLGKRRDRLYSLDNSILQSIDREDNVITCVIKDGLTWSDGVPVSSEDVLYSLCVLLNKRYEGDSRSSFLFDIDGATEFNEERADTVSGFKILNPKAFTVTLDRFTDGFYEALGFRPIPKHYYQSNNYYDIYTKNTSPVGNGAYMLKSFEADSYCKLNVNPNFFRAMPKISSIVLRRVQKDYIYEELARGELDIINFFDYDDSLLNVNIKEKFNLYSMVKNEVFQINTVNANDFTSEKLRRFFLRLIKTGEVKTNNTVLSDSLISTSSIYYSKRKVGTEDDAETVSYLDGIAYYNNKPLNINLLYTSKNNLDRVADIIATIWSNKGILVDTIEVNPYLLRKKISELRGKGENVVVLMSNAHGYKPDFYKLFGGLTRELFRFNDATLDKAALDAMHEEDINKAKELYLQLQDYIYDNSIAKGVGSPIIKTFVRKSLKNVICTESLEWYETDVWNIGYE